MKSPRKYKSAKGVPKLGGVLPKPGDEAKARKAKLIPKKTNYVLEPGDSYTTRIQSIGDSHGVILNDTVMETAGLGPGTDIVIHAGAGIVTIMPLKRR